MTTHDTPSHRITGDTYVTDNSHLRWRRGGRHTCRPYGFGVIVLAMLVLAGCVRVSPSVDEMPGVPAALRINTDHLDHLTQRVVHQGDTLAIVHIYAEPPTYDWLPDDDEGTACVDDAARAAVFHLRRYQATGDAYHRDTARHLLAFVRYMQDDSGLFFNFVWTDALDINVVHENSLADQLNWWTARAVWALGEGLHVLGGERPDEDALNRAALERAVVHVDTLIEHNWGTYKTAAGYRMPAWLMYETAADATSELLLGLIAWDAAEGTPASERRIDRLAQGLEEMRMGGVGQGLRGAHLSYETTWHAWGSSMGQALAATDRWHSAQAEADAFFPWLVATGWVHSFPAAHPDSIRRFEQIAYGVRPVVGSLAGVFARTGKDDYARMAGLATSWLTGNNPAGLPMYNPATGMGYDGISILDGRISRSVNSGAESTIEALLALHFVQSMPTAWPFALAQSASDPSDDGRTYRVDGEAWRLGLDASTDSFSLTSR